MVGRLVLRLKMSCYSHFRFFFGGDGSGGGEGGGHVILRTVVEYSDIQ